MAAVTMKQLLEAGVHFGHQTRRWNPKMEPYIYGERNGIHIVDLRQTLEQVQRAYDFVRDTVAAGGTVRWVGTEAFGARALAARNDFYTRAPAGAGPVPVPQPLLRPRPSNTRLAGPSASPNNARTEAGVITPWNRAAASPTKKVQAEIWR